MPISLDISWWLTGSSGMDGAGFTVQLGSVSACVLSWVAVSQTGLLGEGIATSGIITGGLLAPIGYSNGGP